MVGPIVLMMTEIHYSGITTRLFIQNIDDKNLNSNMI